MLGKIVFIFIASVVMACICIGLAVLGRQLCSVLVPGIYLEPAPTYLGLFSAAAFMNSAFGAYCAIRLPNPRLVPLVSLLLVAVLIGIYYGILAVMPLSTWVLGLFFCAAGVFCLILALREFEGERVIRPVSN